MTGRPSPLSLTLWVLVVAGCLIGLVSFGTRASFGLFVDPVAGPIEQGGFGFGREAFAIAMAIQNLAWGVGQPIAGMLADRFGPWRVIAGGGLLFSAGLALSIISTDPGSYSLTAGLMVGLGMSGAGHNTVLAAFGQLMPENRRGWAIAMVGLFNVLGGYSAGIACGRYSRKFLLLWIYFLRGLATIAFLLLPISPLTALGYGAVMGLLWLSTVPPTVQLVGVMFGNKYLSTLFGFVFLSHQIGGFVGVLLGGFLYSATGQYDIVWWISVALAFFAAAVHLPIQETLFRQGPTQQPA